MLQMTWELTEQHVSVKGGVTVAHWEWVSGHQGWGSPQGPGTLDGHRCSSIWVQPRFCTAPVAVNGGVVLQSHLRCWGGNKPDLERCLGIFGDELKINYIQICSGGWWFPSATGWQTSLKINIKHCILSTAWPHLFSVTVAPSTESGGE